MNSKISSTILIGIIISFRICAQHDTALPFLYDQVSVSLIAAGQTGTANLTIDALGFYYNPAQLGYSSRYNNFAFSFMPAQTEIPSYMPLNIRSYGLQVGFNFQKLNNSFPFSVGIGFIHSKIKFGEDYSGSEIATDVEPEDAYSSISLGASYKYFAYFNVGISLKKLNSLLTGFYTLNGSKEFRYKGTSYDFGTLIILPISELWFTKQIFTSADYPVYPKANFSVGYAIDNFGNNVYYFDPSYTDPLPRTARMGYSFNLGFDLRTERDQINLIDYSFTAESDDIITKDVLIVNQDSTNKIGYEGMFGKIISAKHLILLESDGDVVIHKAHTFNLLESFTYSTGRMTGRDYLNISTEGIGISSRGIFKLLNLITENIIIDFIAEHFSVEYNSATYNHPYFPLPKSSMRKYKSISLHVSNFSF